MFHIKILDTVECQYEGACFGQIRIGKFTERFLCYPVTCPISELENQWKEELRKLLEGKSAVALVHDSRFAWILYRNADHCFIQQAMSLNGDFAEHLSIRKTFTEEGIKISEWSTKLIEIKQFLES